MQTKTVIRLTAVKGKTGLSKSTIYRLEAEGEFPKRIQLGAGHAVGWHLHEIDEWLATRPRVADTSKTA